LSWVLDSFVHGRLQNLKTSKDTFGHDITPLIPTHTSPAANGVAPIIWFSFFTSSVGPASREVPVSAMAWQPPEQKSVEVLPDTWILKKDKQFQIQDIKTSISKKDLLLERLLKA